MTLEAIGDSRYIEILQDKNEQSGGYTTNSEGGTSIKAGELELALQASLPGPFSEKAVGKYLTINRQKEELREDSALLTNACVLGIIIRRFMNGVRVELSEYFPTGSNDGIEHLKDILNNNFDYDPYTWAFRVWNECGAGLANGKDIGQWERVLKFWTRERSANELIILNPDTKVLLQLGGVFNVRFTPKKQINTSLSLPASIDAVFYNSDQIGILEWGGGLSKENLLNIGLLMAAVDAHREKILGEGWWGNQKRDGFMTTGYKEVSNGFNGISYSRIFFNQSKVEVVNHIGVEDIEAKNKIYCEALRFAKEINHPSAKERFLEIKRIKGKTNPAPTPAIWSV